MPTRTLAGRSLDRIALVALALAMLAACTGKPSPDETVRKAQSALAQGHYAQAMGDLKGVLQADPQHRAARIAFARLYLAVGDTDQALAELNRVAKPAAQDAALRELRYEILLAGRRYEDALKQLANESVLDRAHRLTFLGMAQGGSGHFEEAERSFEEALTLSPADSRIVLERARNHLSAGRIDTAAEQLAPLLQRQPPLAGAWLLSGNVAMQRADFKQAREAFTKANELRSSLRVPEQVTALTGIAEASLSLADIVGAEHAITSLSEIAPNAVVLHFLKGRLALAKNDAQAAISELRVVAQAAPDQAEPRRLLAMALAGSGSLEAARNELIAVLESHPAEFAVRKQLAQLELTRGDPAAARRWLESAPAGSPADSQSDWLLGSAILMTGETPEGLAYLERSVAADPRNEDNRIALAAQYLANGQRDKSIALLEALPASAGKGRRQALLLLARTSGLKPEQANQEIERLLEQYRDDASFLSAAGSYFLAKGEAARAVDLMRRAVEKSGSSPYRLMLAQAQARAGDVAGAQKSLQEVVAADPKQQGAYLGLARLALSKGDRPAGKAWLEKAIAANPSAIEARLALAQLAFAAQDATRAKGLLDQVVTVAGRRPEVLITVGQLQVQGGQYEAAVATLAGAESVARVPDANLTLGQAYLALNRKPEAQAAFEKALAGKPRWRPAVTAAAFNNLAWLYYESGDSRAIETASKAYAMGADIPEVADTYGWILVERNRAAEGLPILEKAVTARGGKVDAQITYHLAAAYARTGAKDRSRATLKGLLENQAVFASRRDAEELLKSLTK